MVDVFADLQWRDLDWVGQSQLSRRAHRHAAGKTLQPNQLLHPVRSLPASALAFALLNSLTGD